MSSDAPARSTARTVQNLIGIAENVTLEADPAALIRELLVVAGMTLRNPAGQATWWQDLTAWIADRGGDMIPAPDHQGNQDYPPIVKAPGRHVRATA